MIFDPLYMLVLLVGMALSGWASLKTRTTFDRYSKLPTRSGLTGAQVAQRILSENGISDVTIEPVPGKLSDHYDPRSKTLRLSEPVYGGTSMAAFGVAAHEVGHALQDAYGYAPLKFRSAWVPVAGIGSNIGIWMVLGAFFMGGVESVPVLAYSGLALFAAVTVFTLITLPVEFDASKRALVTLESGSYMSGEELQGAKKVLDAAAMTYVAAAVTSLLTLFYWAARLGLFGSRDD